MKAADTKIIKGVREFISDILPKVKISDFGFWAEDVTKSKDQKKSSFGFNFAVAPGNFPGIFNEEDYLKKIKSGLGKRIGKKIRYLKIHWSFQDDVAVEYMQPCCISFDIKLA